MKPTNVFSVRLLPLALLGATLASSVAMGDFTELLRSPTRPTTQQIEKLLDDGWRPQPLDNATDLPKDPNKPSPDLQYNYPVWYKTAVEGMPRLIACLEQTFPGGKFVFIGRDTAAFVDFLEAFYHSLGQEDRVGSIGISSASLTHMTAKQAFHLLTSAGMPSDPKQFKHPFVLIDTISRGGGRQGRHLLNAAYDYFRSKNTDLGSLASYLNFVGLRGSTTSIANHNVCGGFSILNSAVYRAFGSGPELFTENHILGFDDGRQPKTSYLGLNEASYTHWVGGWHGPYGEVHQGGLLGSRIWAEPGPVYSEDVRAAVMNYQIHLIMAAREKSFLANVQAQASQLGYSFPQNRPAYIPNPLTRLAAALDSSTTLEDLDKAWTAYPTYSMGRIAPSDLLTTLDAKAVSILQTSANPANMANYAPFVAKYISWNRKVAFLSTTLPYFLATHPNDEQLSAVIDLIQGDENMTITVMKHVATRLTAGEVLAPEVLAKLPLQQSSANASRPYKTAEKELKKATNKGDDSKLKKFFQRFGKTKNN